MSTVRQVVSEIHIPNIPHNLILDNLEIVMKTHVCHKPENLQTC